MSTLSNIFNFDTLEVMPDFENNPPNINFMPDNAETRASIGQQLFRFVISRGKTIIIITEAIVLIVFLSRFKLDREVRDLKENIDNKAAIVRSTSTIENDYRRIQAKTKTLEQIFHDQIDWRHRLDEFDNKVTSGMYLESISYVDDNIQLKAKVNSAESFGTFLEIMLSDSSVESVILQSSTYDSITESYSFSMQIVKRI